MIDGAENLPGLKHATEDMDVWISYNRGIFSSVIRNPCVVGEHFTCAEAGPVRAGGARRRENVGMSNHNPNEKLRPRKPKVSVALSINHGLGGPKAMAKAAVDGQLVNIPALPCVFIYSDEVNREECLIGLASIL